MNYLNRALEVVKRHPVATAVGATAGAALLHTAMNSTGYDGQGIMDAHPTLRFVPYFANSLACAELNAQRVRNEKGRDLTFGEKMTSYLYGATTPMILWEGWEEVGATEPFYKALNRVFGGMAKQEYEGKGSFIDLAATVGAVMAIETSKEGLHYASRLARRRAT